MKPLSPTFMSRRYRVTRHSVSVVELVGFLADPIPSGLTEMWADELCISFAKAQSLR